jgi:hypothetical protein
MQKMWIPPFLKKEAEALIAAGYQDIGWREVCTEAFGLPNAKVHILLVATSATSALVDCCLFSTVCLNLGCVLVCPATHLLGDVPVLTGTAQLFSLPGHLLPVR